MQIFSSSHHIGGYVQPEGDVIETVEIQGTVGNKNFLVMVIKGHCIKLRHSKTVKRKQ
jgi:hypothetical protein